MIEQTNNSYESRESQHFDAELDSLFQEVTRQVEQVRPDNTDLAEQLDQVIDDLKALHLDAVKEQLQHLELPELLATQLESIQNQLEQKLQQLEEMVDRSLPSDNAPQKEKDTYFAYQAKQTQQKIEQDTLSLLTQDLGKSENYYADPLSQGVAWLLRRIKNMLQKTSF